MAATALADAAPAASLPLLGAPEVARSDLAAVKAAMSLCLVSMWAGSAGAGVAALALAFHPAPVVEGIIDASLGSNLISSVFFLAVMPLLLRAALRGVDSMAKFRKASGTILRMMVLDTALHQCLTTLTLVMLTTVGCLGLEVSKQPRAGGIGRVLPGVGLACSSGIVCFYTVPHLLMKIWRTKPDGAAAAGGIA
ncbi:hypothetical protein EJB05_49064 [Eragrostis curvula]|uniref:Uncharacterized protein n=1 Tax=Eragrostis curvula TaxID=38414 RepID=A0A5J9T3B8_9POAL|nr:hypothetical protein EJB05_49064 [Eragrostis curvula]